MCTILWLETSVYNIVVGDKCVQYCGWRLVCTILWLQTSVYNIVVGD